MDSSFDCSVSSLLCTEDASFFDDNEYSETVNDDDEVNNGELDDDNNDQRQPSERFDGSNGLFLLQCDEALSLMVEKECQYMASAEYLKRLRSGDLELQGRKKVIDWIQKAIAQFGFGPLCAYLSINYFDRFLSAYEFPKDTAWMMQLLAVACLSLAAKMDEIEVPLAPDLQIDETTFVFEGKTIQRMELLVLSTLKWRMQAVTPFSFADNFIHKINDKELPPPRSSVLLAIQLILNTIKGIDFLEFKPSEIAAAVAILVLNDNQKIDIEKASTFLPKQVEKRRVVKCIELFYELALISGCNKRGDGSHSLLPQSPVGLLDAACFSYKSDITMTGSCANSVNSTRETKRRKQSTACKVDL